MDSATTRGMTNPGGSQTRSKKGSASQEGRTMSADCQDYQQREFAYRKSPDQDAATPVRHPVVVVGAGPIGLALAIDLAARQVPVVLVDDDFRLSSGSRAICF